MPPSIPQLVATLRRRHDLEPAAWAMAKPIPRDVSLAAARASLDPRLVEYAKAAERASFRAEVAALVSHGGGFYWSVCPVRTSNVASARLTPSTLVTLLCGASTLAVDPDSGAFTIAEWSSSAVCSFLFDDVVDSDPKPGDFVFEARSLDRWLRAMGDPARRPTLDAAGRRLSRRYRRGIWVSHCVGQAVLPPDLDRVVHTARDAAPFADYLVERRAFGKNPHDALYWLLCFSLVGAEEQLADALARSVEVRHPAVVDLRRRLSRKVDLLAHTRWKRAERTALAELRERVT